ncbi:hypothetical protein EYF80_013914 [Liparis tanakae]|uniref:Uncharacterized protein n=1 Tax=Liparis tanakae TaxID=230148 RepID=A0A4Z2IER7_9TELE|nr:hypothetical protein EYF80_013914 [Liparis tanakae]
MGDDAHNFFNCTVYLDYTLDHWLSWGKVRRVPEARCHLIRSEGTTQTTGPGKLTTQEAWMGKWAMFHKRGNPVPMMENDMSGKGVHWMGSTGQLQTERSLALPESSTPSPMLITLPLQPY